MKIRRNTTLSLLLRGFLSKGRVKHAVQSLKYSAMSEIIEKCTKHIGGPDYFKNRFTLVGQKRHP